MNSIFSLDQLTRENVKQLVPYSSARDEFSGNGSVFLDANENPYENGVNRYPDPLQNELKKRLTQIKGISPSRMILGNGSDEVIDLLFRAFCEPNRDNVVICTPTYGMYEVAAGVNAIEIKEVALDENFQPDVQEVQKAMNEYSKMLFLCSPNNPTANLYNEDKMISLLETFPGIVIVDEAYIDFAPGKSLIDKLEKYPNLVILQTLSKAWGMAGIRLGIGFASEEIIEILNRIKPPYNVNSLSQERALDLLDDEAKYLNQVNGILKDRVKMSEFLASLSCVQKVYESDANFILVKVDDAKLLYSFLLDKGIIIRDRSKIAGLENCVRISIGTEKENQLLCESLIEYNSKS
ncbi:histidinol-phosphate transaminase [Marinifilum caeruleilacunae]|uniref:Histidinol-phosphate aminotransferase n=1 Tax=Marinifilum caeruleilacunae TaxID=2499076 RepID=A0ABX1WXP9_9BACT|nr:histidinol-phosphate transaminase [Marinifilum caeruleilacunae]NOU60664.1 histidinol-phosphate transaminase [Marinifilum caeruleilacunae]